MTSVLDQQPSPDMSRSAATGISPLRRISEDSRLRPFLSQLFDSQAYIKTVIKEGRSEECFNNIVSCIDDINVEIKGYISQHKDDLMSGMQDVATLADRYTNLSATSQKLHRNVERLKKETIDSHQLVRSRTEELQRMHETSTTLHSLKLFVHAKQQLDDYLGNADEKDLRNLSNAAKSLSELERLLLNPRLLEIRLVSDCVENIKLFGKNVRILAQDRLLSAITEKNQAAMASSLQVFYNLDSLPEIILLVIDHTVKRTVDNSRAALDIDTIHRLMHGGGGGGGGGGGSSGAVTAGAAAAAASRLLASATKKMAAAADTTGGAGAGVTTTGTPGSNHAGADQQDTLLQQSGTAGVATRSITSTTRTATAHNSANATAPVASSASQLRIAMREVAHVWSSMIHEMAMQIHVFQRVVAKKEDPTTHEKFIQVLHRTLVASQSGQQSSSLDSDNTTTNALLSRGRLLELFWRRLSVSMRDVATEKVRQYTIACSRVYPSIRQAAVQVVMELESSWRTSTSSIAADATPAAAAAAAAAAMARNEDGDYACSTSSLSTGISTRSDRRGEIGDSAASSNSINTSVKSRCNIYQISSFLNNGDEGFEFEQMGATGRGPRGRLAAISTTTAAALGGGTDSSNSTSTGAGTGLFGSLQWTQSDLLDTAANYTLKLKQHRNSLLLLAPSSINTTPINNDRIDTTGAATSSTSTSSSSVSSSIRNQQSSLSSQDIAGAGIYGMLQQRQHQFEDHPLVDGLKPMRDRFLAGVLSRMSAPILQMFPELEGYTAAVPSKRDLQTLIRAIQAEFVAVLTESGGGGGGASGGDVGLVTLICREFQKTVRLMLSKIEGMIIVDTGANAGGIGKGTVPQSSGSTTTFTGTTAVGMLGTGSSSNHSTNTTGSNSISSVLLPAGARTINTTNMNPSNGFQKTHAQAHNLQLLTLLVQFQEALEKIPTQVMKSVMDSLNSISTSKVATGRDTEGAAIASAGTVTTTTTTVGLRLLQQGVAEIEAAARVTGAWIEHVAKNDILDAIVQLMSNYITTVLANLHKEGIVGGSGSGSGGGGSSLPSSTSTTTTATPSAKSGYTGKAPSSASPAMKQHQQQQSAEEDVASLECSVAVQTVVKHLPIMLQQHLLCLPKCRVVDACLEEVYVRTLHTYLTVAALLRPVSEACRLRTTKDLTALEMLLSGLYAMPQPQLCPVLRECKAFRRLLFQQQESAGSTGSTGSTRTSTSNTGKNVLLPSATSAQTPPTARDLLALPYFHDLRPSTLLSYLVSCAPAQLPSPYAAATTTTMGDATATNSGSSAEQQQQQQQQVLNYVYELTLPLSLQLQQQGDDVVHISSTGGTAAYAYSSISSVRRLYANPGGFSDTMHEYHARSTSVNTGTGIGTSVPSGRGGGVAVAGTGLGAAGGYDWRGIPNEVRSWMAVQRSLDAFFQRLSVAASEDVDVDVDAVRVVGGGSTGSTSTSSKQNMRLWYESILDVGSKLF